MGLIKDVMQAMRDQSKEPSSDAYSGSIGQNISATDLLCEGPIHGLVDGAASLYLDNNPALQARLKSFAPSRNEEGSDESGTITFSNGVVGTVDNNTFIPDNLTNSASSPRKLRLIDPTPLYVTLGTLSTSTSYYSILVSGTGFSAADHATVIGMRETVLVLESTVILGSFFVVSPTTGVFIWGMGGPILDVDNEAAPGKPGSIKVVHVATVTDINPSANTITVSSTDISGSPQSFNGTYGFYLGESGYFNASEGSTGSSTFNPDAVTGKIDNLYVQENTGWLDQEPIRDVGGVGGAVVVQGSTSGVNLPTLKILNPANAAANGVTLFDTNGMPNISDNGDYPGTPDFSDTNSSPTILNSSDFGLDTAAKIGEADKVKFDITYPQGIFSQDQEKGDRHTNYAFYDIKIEFQINGGTTWQNPVEPFGGLVKHKGKKQSALNFQHQVDLEVYRSLNFTNFRIKIIRVTRHIGLPVVSMGGIDTNRFNTNKQRYTVLLKSQVDNLQAINEDKFSYPYSAIVNSTFSSRSFKDPPKRSYDIKGKLVKIPSAYTPRDSAPLGRAVYGNFWDGTFKSDLCYTDNPAWIFYDIVTNNRYGAGKWIKESDIDKYALYRISKFCDELVDSNDTIPATFGKRGEFYKIVSLGSTDWNEVAGTSGVTYGVTGVFRLKAVPSTGTGEMSRLEPRFSMNILLTKSLPVYKVLKDMCSAFTSMLYWMDGQLTVVQDTPQEPVAVFAKANVIDGSFTYESSSVKNRPNQIVVNWNDPTIDYELSPLIVEDSADIVKQNKVITEECVAYGCTSESQAIRYGKWKLWTAQNQKEIVYFNTSLEGSYVRPGDIISVQDSDRRGVQFGGRIQSSTNSSVTLDRSITLTGGTYKIFVVSTAPGAIYTGSVDIAINGVTYSRGDLLPEAYIYMDTNANGVRDTLTLLSLDEESLASNAFAANGEPLSVEWKPYITAEGHQITQTSGSVTTVSLVGSNTFTTIPTAGAVWTIKEIGGAGSAKDYKVLNIDKAEKNIYSITAAEHYNEKFTAVEGQYDLGNVPTNSDAPEQEPDEIPPPTNLLVAPSGPTAFPDTSLLLTFTPPETNFVAAFQILTNIDDIGMFTQTETHKEFTGIIANKYSFKVRTMSPKGAVSEWAETEYSATSPSVGTENPDNVHGIKKWITASKEAEIVRDISDTTNEKYSISSPYFVVEVYQKNNTSPEYAYYHWNTTGNLLQTSTNATTGLPNGGENAIAAQNVPAAALSTTVVRAEDPATNKVYEYKASTFVANGPRHGATAGEVHKFYKITSNRSEGAYGEEVFRFKNYPVQIAQREAPDSFKVITTEAPNGKVDLSSVVDDDSRELYVIFDYSVPKLFLGEWDTKANGDGPAFWRDANDTMPNAWTALTVTSAYVTRDTNKLIGTGTAFSSEVQVGDVISLANLTTLPENTLGDAAIVTNVMSDTQLTIDRTFTATKTLTNLYVPVFRPDINNDAIAADISRPT
jgi:predicted phage tail protein